MKSTSLLLFGAALGLGVVTLLRPLPAFAFSEATQCRITQVRVGGTPVRHDYEFERLCNDGRVPVKVSGAYHAFSGRTDEKIVSLAGPSWSVRSLWTCSGDPWIYGAAMPDCGRGKVAKTGAPQEYEFDPTFPVSAATLTPEDRHVLAVQLENAMAAASVPPAAEVGAGGLHVDDQVQAVPQDSGRVLGGALDVVQAGKGTDLTVAGISGPSALKAGLSGAYTVTVKNEGGVAALLELVIVFGGKLDQTGKIVAGAGLSCEVGHDAGINAALRCTGGQLAAGGTTSVVVQGRGQSAGAGMLIATLNASRSVVEANYDNNFRQLNMTVN
jgi:hypothetical protein